MLGNLKEEILARQNLRWHFTVLLSLVLLSQPGCANHPGPFRALPQNNLNPLGYTIQIGAFARLDNAVRLTNKLEMQGVDAYYFVHSSGLYKVRFGNFPTKGAARRIAENLRTKTIITDFYIVPPDTYPAARQKKLGGDYLRGSIVKTARSFLGVPYKWGGTDPDKGLDCSGLSLAVYQLNGLDLPRTSKQQFAAGMPVGVKNLKQGDLLFFATGRRNRVSHVGIYAGGDLFIHAPGRGKKISMASLTSSYFKSKFLGARTYF